MPEPVGWVGSSPRGRGKLAGHQACHASGRLIPARAGKTVRPGRYQKQPWAHPRAGGENAPSSVPSSWYSGSSPRGRGKPDARLAHESAGRLIPARAGKTGYLTRRTRQFAAHPRAGGENLNEVAISTAPVGSSPRGRGKQRPPANHLTAGGLIPARAGKTPTVRSGNPRAPAHPRAGGENIEGEKEILPPTGSSPRGRGKLHYSSDPPPPHGLIPARAGKTLRGDPHLRNPAAHPRAGGENELGGGGFSAGMGSSPRGRGKLGEP